MDDEASGDSIGDLTVADTMLGMLLQDILSSVPDGEKRLRETTNQAANRLKRCAEQRPDLFPDGFPRWLARIQCAAEERNKIIHAAAVNRCVTCGKAARFTHQGQPVDRSTEAVRSLTARIDALRLEGVELARDVSERINVAHLQAAKAKMRETGQPQSPPQVLIGQSWSQCADCSESGRSQVVIPVPTAVAVLPPDDDPTADHEGSQPPGSP